MVLVTWYSCRSCSGSVLPLLTLTDQGRLLPVTSGNGILHYGQARHGNVAKGFGTTDVVPFSP